MAAFQATALELGLPPVPAAIVDAPTTLKSGRGALAELMRAAPDIDAVFCSSDLLALGVLTEARVRGIDVPAQLGVVGFGDLEYAADVEPSLTTVHIKGAEIGRQAARFIIDRAEGREVDQRVIDIGFSIVERHST
jgi:LacI family gluconate utilization system Gnt-I transcriptional repressor